MKGDGREKKTVTTRVETRSYKRNVAVATAQTEDKDDIDYRNEETCKQESYEQAPPASTPTTLKPDFTSGFNEFLKRASKLPVSKEALLAITAVGILLAFAFVNDSPISVPKPQDWIGQLMKDYPNQTKWWKHVNASIRLSKKTAKPGVILAIHSNNNESFVNCLVGKTGRAIALSLSQGKSQEIYVVNSTCEFDNTFMETVLHKRKELGVVVFYHLEGLLPKHAESLHFICDGDPNENTLAVIILVLKVDRKISSQNFADVATETLSRLWKAALKNRFNPVRGRITNQIHSFDEERIEHCSGYEVIQSC